MGLRGPTTQPAAVVRAKGNYRPSRYKDEIADEEALEFVYQKLPDPPKGFTPLAVKCWNAQLAQAMQLYGYISFLDLKVFEEYCLTYALMKTLEDADMHYEDANGVRRITPEFKEYKEAKRDFLALSREFGFTPSSRTSIKLTQKKTAEKFDEWEEGI